MGIAEDKQSYARFTAEIRNKAFAQAYLVVAKLIEQQDFAAKLGLDQGHFSRILRKYRKSTQAATPAI